MNEQELADYEWAKAWMTWAADDAYWGWHVGKLIYPKGEVRL